MTSTVIVQAHCADNKHVKVEICEKDCVDQEFVVENGQTGTYHIYDERILSVREVERS